jgi:hypothetical protein
MSESLHDRPARDETARRSPDAGDAEPWDAAWLDERAPSPMRFWRVMVVLAFVGVVLLLVGWSLNMLLWSERGAEAVR